MSEMPVLQGLDTAPEYFVEDLISIRFCGVTTLFTPYRTVTTSAGLVRLVPFTARVPTGALAAIERRLFAFARDHKLLARVDQDATR